ncbi:3,4-dihydroxy-2-butanone 4-phosphate synthase [Thermosipho melanesiensis]|uniref:GTP cyclohydrolase-2 n=2 Tax=Thermosipho melanesiensis TaxID=46541 RepID=A6LJ21_THEM4|nr:bifunctional 3,4-dihydroxy-2-butanone-4-phosphate synthase/GTP cyclohydrolase II [Thermosipho melanesiensis]ABR29922.1 GTP cyclohydrolase II [Thermosipho melanesiensis BI429]OOC38528.1 3,4-dihydroxy-2-butanone 4-phosphate synthase [Thermosipho melanesiensis]OOC40332.1 3,4-dihydroxy-2-butanone 4-phosphate synthase [Thermosipho melanesiensis]OOC40596.1 3,4-dihydroxy-2-butanone 4-phosphate synthase [Thermosipho melanesiensis]OOC44443.1 3,4-dihydroxy-2-butanone 4-phosphate synthase [Thermosipho
MKPFILIDSEREKEGDLFVPAQICNEEVVNFFLEKGKGLLCLATYEKGLLERGFFKLPSNGSKTNFFIPVDYGTGTGISVFERTQTIKKISEGLDVSCFTYPGHVFLLGAKDGRWGHTEAATYFSEKLGFSPHGVIIEILNNEGSSHDFEYILEFSKKYSLEVVDIRDLYKEYSKDIFGVETKAKLPTKFDENFEIYTFKNVYDGKEHVAVVKKPLGSVPFVRIHSECATGDIFHSLRCDCGEQLEKSIKIISKQGGILIYLRQEGRGIGLNNKIKAYDLQEKGYDTVEANLMLGFKEDERDYYVAYLILKTFGVKKIRLLTNNPKKSEELKKYGLEVIDIPLNGNLNKYNKKYLKTKVLKMGHKISLKGEKI